MSDCTWGLLDGVNEDGLCASLTFGGRRITGKGFGIPLVIRYCLETCSTTAEAIEKLIKIPVHMAYNVTLMDKDLNYATIYFVPGQANQVHYLPVGTNHQEEITWPDYAAMTRTVERRNILEYAIMNPLEHQASILQKFLQAPLYNTAYEKAFGTLYTAVYKPQQRALELHWPGRTLYQSMDQFESGKMSITLKTNTLRKISL
jgi:predicted choloylglycine hydrolase